MRGGGIFEPLGVCGVLGFFLSRRFADDDLRFALEREVRLKDGGLCGFLVLDARRRDGGAKRLFTPPPPRWGGAIKEFTPPPPRWGGAINELTPPPRWGGAINELTPPPPRWGGAINELIGPSVGGCVPPGAPVGGPPGAPEGGGARPALSGLAVG